MTKEKLRNNTLAFVKRMLPNARWVDVETVTEKIVKNLTYLTEGDSVKTFGGRGDLRLPRPRRGG